ncbi:hypothetical protein CAG51_00155, partial [Vibrio sp. V24_P1S3T111]|nr:hypothetical protein [Vibrio sp. V24_P1S3T111]
MFDKNYRCPVGSLDPKVCTCSSCHLQNEIEKSALALKAAEVKNFTAIEKRFSSINVVNESELIRETPQEKIQRQRRERLIQSEKNWLYVQENEPRYAVHREKILTERKAANKSKYNNTTNFLPSIGIKSKVVATPNKNKDDNATNFLPSIGMKPKDAIVKNFRCGDLMYGTSFGRDENYLKKLEDYHKVNVVNSVIGENNGNEWARKGTRNNRSMIINSYSDPVRA